VERGGGAERGPQLGLKLYGEKGRKKGPDWHFDLQKKKRRQTGALPLGGEKKKKGGRQPSGPTEKKERGEKCRANSSAIVEKTWCHRPGRKKRSTAWPGEKKGQGREGNHKLGRGEGEPPFRQVKGKKTAPHTRQLHPLLDQVKLCRRKGGPSSKKKKKKGKKSKKSKREGEGKRRMGPFLYDTAPSGRKKRGKGGGPGASA